MKKNKAETKKTNRSVSNENVLGMYLNEINRIPLLTREEENQAAREAAKGSVSARNKLINSNLRFVVNVAKKYQGHGLPLEDLISEGNVGLISAIEGYDVERGYHFLSYAVWWIRQSILRALCDKARLIRLPANRASELLHIEKARKALTGNSDSENEICEIAQMLNMDKNDIRELLAISREMVSLETVVSDGKNVSQLENLIEDKRRIAPDQELIQKDLEVDIGKILDTLDKREAEIIRFRYGIGNYMPMSLNELGDRYNLTKERIRQIEQKAIGHLKQPSRKVRLEAYVA